MSHRPVAPEYGQQGDVVSFADALPLLLLMLAAAACARFAEDTAEVFIEDERFDAFALEQVLVVVDRDERVG